MSILYGAEFVFAFYEKLPEYLASKNRDKTRAKEYKRLAAFLQKTKSTLDKLRDSTSIHAAREQKIFIDAMISLAQEYLTNGGETEACAKYQEDIEYALFVWGLLSPLPKKIESLSRNAEKANESHYYSTEKLTNMLFDAPKNLTFYYDMFRTPFEKIKRASETYRAQYIRLAKAASSEEGMTFATSMAESMKQMYYSYTLIYEVLNLTLKTSKCAYVTMFNSMPSVIIGALSRELTKKDIKVLRDYVKRLDKLCRENDWMKFLRIEIPTEELLASEPAPELEETADEPIVPENEAPIEDMTQATPVDEPTSDEPTEETVAPDETAAPKVVEEQTPAEAEEVTEEEAPELTVEQAAPEAAPEEAASEVEETTDTPTEAEETALESTDEQAPESDTSTDELLDVL